MPAKVLSGTLSAKVDGEVRTVEARTAFTVPPGTPHRWWNDTDAEVVIEYRVSPALPLDRFLESVFALVHMGESDEHGLPGPLRMSRVLRRHWDVLYLAQPPLPVQKLVMFLLSLVARLKGYPDEYPYPFGRDGEE